MNMPLSAMSDRPRLLQTLASSPYFWSAALALVIQQSAVALSVYFLTQSVLAIPDTRSALYWFAWYTFSLVFPYFPGLLSNYLFEMWTLDSVRRFQTLSLASGKTRPRDFTNTPLKETKETVFANTAPSVISDTCSYIQELLSTSLNSFFSIFAIAVVVSGDILMAYMTSLACCLAYTYFLSDKAREKAAAAEESRVELVSHTEDVWPTLTLGNHALDQLWEARFKKLFDDFWHKSRAEKLLRNGSSVALSLISVMPTACLMVWLFWSHTDDASFLAALLVTAPRVFQLLSMLGQFSSLLFEVHRLKGRASVIELFFSRSAESERIGRLSGITADWNGERWKLEQSRDELLMSIQISTHGRVSVRGPNGSGKSTFLLDLKERMGSNAIYLPPGPIFSYDQALSSGERKIAELERILQLTGIKCLLLDEWDANLDQERASYIDKKLETLSTSKLVVEVRHRAN
jgi:ABC-type multidrug transport system fused ATPase/permease subunit